MERFDFENLDVFNVAVEMLICVDAIAEVLPTGRAYLRDELRRAANSVVLNITEGAGEYSPGDKARFYRMAKRSSTEAAAQVSGFIQGHVEHVEVLEVEPFHHSPPAAHPTPPAPW